MNRESTHPNPEEDKLVKESRHIRDFHTGMLENLREAQPLIVLSSLSLVLAAFSQNVSQGAIFYSVSASVAFLTALWFTIMYPPKWSIQPILRIPFSGGAVIATYAGLVLLSNVASEYATKFSMARDISKVLSFSVSLLFESVVIAFVWTKTEEMSQRRPEWLRSRPAIRVFLRLSRWISLVLLATWIVLEGVSYLTNVSTWIPLVPYVAPWILAAYVWGLSRQISRPLPPAPPDVLPGR
jgi:hypothetical protein